MNLEKRLPAFEGRPVNGTNVKITGAVPMDDLDGLILGIDDAVQLAVMLTCVNVHHDTDAKGNLIRTHILRPTYVVPSPIDPDDPSGDFVVRAFPEIVASTVEEKEEDQGYDDGSDQ